MATKSRDSWSDAYRRRIERAEAAGKTRQQARGHKEKEHVARKERELLEAQTGKVSSSQKQAMRKFVLEQAKKSRDKADDPDEIWDDYKPYFIDKGWQWFLVLRTQQRAFAKQGRGAVGSLAQMDAIAGRLDAEAWMLFYH